MSANFVLIAGAGEIDSHGLGHDSRFHDCYRFF